MDSKHLIEQAQSRHPRAAASLPQTPQDARLMLLPAATPEGIKLVRIPDDYQPQDAFRHLTGLIAGVEGRHPECTWDDIQPVLEDQGFETVEFALGPSLA